MNYVGKTIYSKFSTVLYIVANYESYFLVAFNKTALSSISLCLSISIAFLQNNNTPTTTAPVESRAYLFILLLLEAETNRANKTHVCQRKHRQRGGVKCN